MSALGHKRTYAVQNGMSALPPTADMCSAKRDVRFVPIPDILTMNDLTSNFPRSSRRSLQSGLAHTFKEFDHWPRRIRDVAFDPRYGVSWLQFLQFRQCSAGLFYPPCLR
jgi:hypothetical protein